MTAHPEDDTRDPSGATAREPLPVAPRVVLERMPLPVLVWDRVSSKVPRGAAGAEPGPEASGAQDTAGRSPSDAGMASIGAHAPRFVFRWANAAFERLSLRSATWASGRPACEVCPGEGVPFREVLDEVLATGEDAQFEHWCEEHKRTCQGHVFRTGANQVSMVMVDVSRQAALLEQAAKTARWTRKRLDALPVMVYELDAGGNALYWNRETARVLDLPEQGSEPRPQEQVLDPRSLEIGRAAIAQVLERDEPVPELVYDLWSRKGQRVTIRATGGRVQHEQGPPTVFVVARDITREREEQDAHQALARTWEPTARSRLRHDLNNVLGRIMAAASLMEMEEALTPAGAQHLEMVLAACEEAAEVVARDRADEKGRA